MDKQEELNEIDMFIGLNQMLLKGDPALTKATVDIESVKDKIDSLLDSRLLIMQT